MGHVGSTEVRVHRGSRLQFSFAPVEVCPVGTQTQGVSDTTMFPHVDPLLLELAKTGKKPTFTGKEDFLQYYKRPLGYVLVVDSLLQKKIGSLCVFEVCITIFLTPRIFFGKCLRRQATKKPEGFLSLLPYPALFGQRFSSRLAGITFWFLVFPLSLRVSRLLSHSGHAPIPFRS